MESEYVLIGHITAALCATQSKSVSGLSREALYSGSSIVYRRKTPHVRTSTTQMPQPCLWAAMESGRYIQKCDFPHEILRCL